MHNLIFRTLNMMLGIGCALIYMALIPNASFASIMIGLMFGMIVCNVFHVIMHEAGHLVFGLISGYEFLSFRVGSHVWLNINGKLQHKRFSLAGTAGQCLMVPPMLQDGKMPFKLYLWGGCITNTVIALIAVGCSLFTQNVYIDLGCYLLAYVGFIYTLQNGLPLKLDMMSNDGFTIDSIAENDAALHAYWLQMMVTAQLARGVALKDVPEEWFIEYPYDQLQNQMVAAAIYFKIIRMMSKHEFDDVEYEIENALQRNVGFVGIHKYMLRCELVYCRLLKGYSIDSYMTPDFKQFLQMMRNNITVLRTQYVLNYKNKEIAQRYLQMFNSMAKLHPYTVEAEDEKEMVRLFDEAMKQKEVEELEDADRDND
ncbi:MAG: hypothetical protein IJO78_07545 [Erysipelotrichaceae bacterium]|nr:hypothetical protein [Erysipelotrichaceae bacterium]